MFVINGKDVIVYKGDSPIFCGKDCTFSEEKELIKASTVTSGVWKEFRLRKRSWSCEITGLTKINNDVDDEFDYFTLISEEEAMSIQELNITFTDADNNVKNIQGFGYIQQSSITGPADAFADASITVIGDGLYTVT